MKNIIFVTVLLFTSVLHAQKVNYMEYFFDSDPGLGRGNSILFTSDLIVTATINVDIASLADGFHNLYVRAKDDSSKWSIPFYRAFYKSKIIADAATGNIVKAEYFLDSDPGINAGTDISITSDSLLSNNFIVDLNSVSFGFHNLYVRVKNAYGNWSTPFYRPFYKSKIATDASMSNIVKAEYFLDADPGLNSGTEIPVTSDSVLSNNFTVDLTNASLGFHNLYVRVKNADGKWSTPFYRPFYKSKIATDASMSNIVKAEYFLDADPGLNSGTEIPVTSDSVLSNNFTVDLTNASLGFHNLYVRVKNADGKWSTPFYRPFYKQKAVGGIAGKVIAIEYFFDTDPGIGFGRNVSVNPDTTIISDFVADISKLGLGSHKLFTRVRNSDNKWSIADSARFSITSVIGCVIDIPADWNLFSIPVKAANMRSTNLFPSASSSAYRYANGYIVTDTLRTGLGYWLRFANAQSFTIYGDSVAATTIPVTAGWNIIGPYIKNISTASMTTTPAGIVNSFFYGFQSGYLAADTLKTGKGYWVRATQNGVLNLSASPAKTNSIAVAAAQIQDDWGKVIISDAAGNVKTLYLKKGDIDLTAFDLPPVPPAGIFDLRFRSSRVVENINQQSGQDILIQGAVYPLTVQVEKLNLAIKDNISGKLVNSKLKSGSNITVRDESVNSLHIQIDDPPKQYALSQNYPNPFNPTTIIRYQIPAAGTVTLKLYDALGREVTTLVNENKEIGYYSVQFNAAGMASGVYIYELKCNSFRAIKKLSLLK